MKNKPKENKQIQIDKIYLNFKKAYENMSENNWHKLLTDFLETINHFSGDNKDERAAAGWVAGLCERAFYVAAYQKEAKARQNFSDQLIKIINSVPLAKFLTSSGPVVCGKRQPAFKLSVSPTLERYEAMQRLSEAFHNKVDAVIIGGSMSYSPFFGIRENIKDKDFSDIDALVVINDIFFKKNAWDKFIDNDIFPLIEKQKFLKRIKVFEKLIQKDAADVFSQRFSVNGRFFTVSIHFVTPSVFKKMVCTDLKKSLRGRVDEQYIMRDFRLEPFRHPCHARHTFDGQRIETVIEGRPVKSGGFISSMPGYLISKGKFYPGVYQTVISTAFLVFYDRTGKTKKLVNEFESILYKEVTNTRKEFPLATYARAHNRYDIFPPGRFEEGNNSYISPKKIRKYISSSYYNIPGTEAKARPGENICFSEQHLEKNNIVREKANNILKEWKAKSLREAETDIDIFINKECFAETMALAKKQGQKWYTVVTIPGIKKIAVAMPYPYKAVGSKRMVIRDEFCIQTITPWEIMRLGEYEKLARVSKKVYVASIMNPADEYNHLPLGYALIVPVL